MLVLEKSYEKETGNRVEYFNPDTTRQFCQWLVGFVDDNSIILKMEKKGFDMKTETMLEEAKIF